MYSQADLNTALHRIPWFLELSQSHFDKLAAISSFIELEPGEFLLREGDREDFLFILIEGQISLEVEVPTRGQIPFFTAEALDVIGWESLTPIVRQRTASARVVKRSQLIGLQSKLLEQVCEEDHDLGYVIMRRVANVVASRLLTTRLAMMEIIVKTTGQPANLKSPSYVKTNH